MVPRVACGGFEQIMKWLKRLKEKAGHFDWHVRQLPTSAKASLTVSEV